MEMNCDNFDIREKHLTWLTQQYLIALRLEKLNELTRYYGLEKVVQVRLQSNEDFRRKKDMPLHGSKCVCADCMFVYLSALRVYFKYLPIDKKNELSMNVFNLTRERISINGRISTFFPLLFILIESHLFSIQKQTTLHDSNTCSICSTKRQVDEYLAIQSNSRILLEMKSENRKRKCDADSDEMPPSKRVVVLS